MRKTVDRIFKNKNIVLGASVILGIAAIIVIYNVIDIKEVLRTLNHATLLLILFYVMIQLTMITILTWRWKVVLQSQGITHISVLKLAKYIVIGQGVSFLTPSGKLGSEPVRAGLVASRENVKFKKALSSVIIDRSIDVTTAVTFFSVGMFVMFFVFVFSPIYSDILLILSSVLLLAIIIFNYRMLNGKKVFHHVFKFFWLHKIKKLSKFEQNLIHVETLIIKFYHEDTKYFYQAAAVSSLSWVLMFFEYKVAGLMVGQSLTPAQSFIIFSFVGMAYMMPVPMALGTLEASQISAFSIMGISTAAGLALSFLVRLKDFLIAIVGILMLVIYGVNLKKTVEETKYLDDKVEQIKEIKADKTKSMKFRIKKFQKEKQIKLNRKKDQQ